MREDVDLVPGDLLREEPLEAGPRHQLRQGRGVAEAVRQPDPAAADAELAGEEALPVDELADQRLPARHDGVALHPHAAQRQEASLGDGGLDPLIHLGAVLLEPGVLLGARHAEDELVGVADQLGHRGRGAGDLADGLPDRPQPRRVDVGVPDGGDAVLGFARGRREDGGQPGAAAGGGAGDVLQVQHVESVVQGLLNAGPPRPGRKLGLQLQQHVQILGEFEDLGLEDAELDPAGGVERTRGGGEDVALLCRQEGVVVEQHRVGRRLQVQLDLLAAGRVAGDRDVLVARVERLHRGAVRQVDQRFGLEPGHVHVEAEVGEQLHPPAGPLRRHRAADPEPGGAPGRPPRGADLVGRVLQGEALARRDRLARQRVPVELDRGAGAVDGGDDALGEHTADAAARELDVVVHGFLRGRAGGAAGRGVASG